MTKLEYQVSFTTPAFLGNAEQQAQWRTPPFKALLRQWWRVAKAKESGYDHLRLREAEGLLFGNAWLEPVNGKARHRRSDVRIRLVPWEDGTLSSQYWPGGPMESVTTTKDGRGQVRADVYLGFGPVLPPSTKEKRPNVTLRGTAIEPDKPQARLQLFGCGIAKDFDETLQLMSWFGTLGSRARNGWGSMRMQPVGDAPAKPEAPKAGDPLLGKISRAWEDCLRLDWPHALGARNGSPLIWLTGFYPDWRKAIGCLANIRVEVRRIAKNFSGPKNIGGIHLLGYPAGPKWDLNLGSEARLASQLRFKVVKTDRGLRGLVAHFPCAAPDAFLAKLDAAQKNWLLANQVRVWGAIHLHLDQSSRVKPLD